MFKKILEIVSSHKSTLIKTSGAIVGGIIGALVLGLIASGLDKEEGEPLVEMKDDKYFPPEE